MKIQCPCGTKYSFDVTAEMVAQPITFVCAQCGVDSSEVVNQLIRETFGASSAPAVAPVTAAKAPLRVSLGKAPAQPATAVAPTAAPAARASALRVSTGAAPAQSQPGVAGDGPQPCHKHVGQFAAERCFVCQKPICPKCMEMFGYLCSAYCKGKAEEQRMVVPVYAGQKAVAEATYWRKSGLIAAAITLAVVGVVAGVAWYKYFGSVPSVAFSVKLPEKALSGTCRIVAQDQVVFLHGGLLARHNMKTKKEVWSRQLIDREKIAREADESLKAMVAARTKAIEHGVEFSAPLPRLEEVKEGLLRGAEAALSLHVGAGYVWVASPEKLVKYDWQTGQPGKEVAFGDAFYEKVRNGDELALIAHDEDGEETIKHVNLMTDEVRVEEKSKAALSSATTNAPNTGGRLAAQIQNAKPGVNAAKAAMVRRAGMPEQKQIDPTAMAASVQNLPLPSRIALPAVLAANANQQRLAAELRDGQPIGQPASRGQTPSPRFERSTYVADGGSQVLFSVGLLEEKTVTRQAMKAPPKRSVLDGDVRVTESAAMANEMFNEMQRERTGGVEMEDVSRYSVRVRRGTAEWTGEVVGQPLLFPLKTHDVVAGAKRIIVLDKQAKKMWESPLNFDIADGLWTGSVDNPSPYGAGPCVEKGDRLYIIDKGVLTAFEAGTGNAHWRMPSVGIAGIHFDDEGMMYVNTTTASPESIKYSQQIDVTDQTRNQILKVDPANGKTLWSVTQEGLINYLSGKFIYTIASHPGDEMEGSPLAGIPGATTAPHVRIKRLNPKNGRIMWEHYQRRAPLDIQIDKNTIQILFKKEMQVLKFISL